MRRNVFVAIGEDCWVAIFEKPDPAKVLLGHSLETGGSSLLMMIEALEHSSTLWWNSSLRIRTSDLMVYSTLMRGFEPPEHLRGRFERIMASFANQGVAANFERDTVRHPHPLLAMATELLASARCLSPGATFVYRLDEVLSRPSVELTTNPQL